VKLRVLLLVMYALLLIVALAWKFANAGDPFEWIFVVMLTMPWSWLLSDLTAAISPALMESSIWYDSLLILCAGINCVIFFLIGKGIDYIWARTRKITA